MADHPADFKKTVKQAVEDWGNTVSPPAKLWSQMLLLRQQQAEATVPLDHPLTPRLLLNCVLENGLQVLGQQNKDYEAVLRTRFIDKCSIVAASEALAIATATVSRYQEQGLELLADIVWQQELRLRANWQHVIEGRLEKPTYSDNKLFGVDELAAKLKAYLTQNEAPWLISLVGLGGIGKTSLADFMVRQLIPTFHFYDMVWLRLAHPTIHGRSRSPQQALQTLSLQLTERVLPNQAAALTQAEQAIRLRQRLKEERYLIVVDNLEEDADLSLLLPYLHDLAQPSKFLLTTRAQPQGETAVFTQELGEISRQAAAQLIRHHAQTIGLLPYAEIGETEINAIYERTGGNPLAIKLVVGMLKAVPPPVAIANLQANRTHNVKKMYRRIYRQTWGYLSEPARQVLRAMPLVGEAVAPIDYIQHLCGLDDDRFWPAIQELRQRSLIEVRGSLNEPLYGIHRLTDTFLRSDIIDGFDRFDNEPDEDENEDNDDDNVNNGSL
ncbi:MAG: NB-ARC domain-containing protein [Chloroflexota bacterium]